MADYRSSVDGTVVSSEVVLSYPWIELGDDGLPVDSQNEIMVKTSDYILLEVGDDQVLAAAAKAAELARIYLPRLDLIEALDAIIDAEPPVLPENLVTYLGDPVVSGSDYVVHSA